MVWGVAWINPIQDLQGIHSRCSTLFFRDAKQTRGNFSVVMDERARDGCDGDVTFESTRKQTRTNSVVAMGDRAPDECDSGGGRGVGAGRAAGRWRRARGRGGGRGAGWRGAEREMDDESVAAWACARLSEPKRALMRRAVHALGGDAVRGMVAEVRGMGGVALQRSQANALHTKARAGIEAAHPQMAADPWPLHLGDILHTLEGQRPHHFTTIKPSPPTRHRELFQLRREAFFNALTNTPLAPLIPFTRSFFATSSQLLTDPRLSTTALTSGRGVRQGDPLGPLLFAASIQQHLRRVATELPEVTVLAYADHITLIGPATATLGALKVLTPLLAQDGLTCNLRKSSAWSSSPLEGNELPEGLPLTQEGVRVLGSPVGSQRFCADLVRSTLTDAAAPLGSLASIHPQHTLLLLSRCISRRIGYLLRTTPADVLPLSEWHAWCAELLNTALTAASIQPPRRETEFNFLLRQATLPVALGGLGLTDPTTEAAPAYLASTTEALRLLRSLDLPATAALGSNSNALQPSAAHSVTIQDMEG
ncbi:unnamed protein product [Closterium sp. NIES-54]